MLRDERDFWIQIRRGLSIVTHAIANEKMDDPFWRTILRGLNIVVRAIEVKWHLPRRSFRTIGQTLPELPATPLAQTSTEAEVKADAI